MVLVRNRRGVAFRVIARQGVDAADLCSYGVRIDATPGDGRVLQRVGIGGTVERATPKGSRGWKCFSAIRTIYPLPNLKAGRP